MKRPSLDTALFPGLHRYLRARLAESSLITADRRNALDHISTYIVKKAKSGGPARLTFICTHNSRRSQMAQIWAQTAAQFFGVPGVFAFSGGTEVTAFDPRAVSAMARAGFRTERSSNDDNDDNPVYLVHAGDGLPPVRAFSKAYLDRTNPMDGFCAVLTCSSADRDCPMITGADERVLIPYADPKSGDGTARETALYDDRCREICREMGWLFASVANA